MRENGSRIFVIFQEKNPVVFNKKSEMDIKPLFTRVFLVEVLFIFEKSLLNFLL